MRRDVSHSTAPVVHGRRCRDVALPLLANAIENNATKDEEEHQTKRDSESDKNHKAQGHMLLSTWG